MRRRKTCHRKTEGRNTARKAGRAAALSLPSLTLATRRLEWGHFTHPLTHQVAAYTMCVTGCT